MNLARKRPTSIKFHQQKNGHGYFSIHNRLRRLYYEESAKKDSLPLQVGEILVL